MVRASGQDSGAAICINWSLSAWRNPEKAIWRVPLSQAQYARTNAFRSASYE